MKASTYHTVSICICYKHTLCHQKLVCKSVGQSIRGMGGKEVNEKASTHHAVSICVCY